MKGPGTSATESGGAKPARQKRDRNFVKVGAIKVRWYRLGDGRTMVDPRRYGRKLISFTDHAAALREAERIALELNAGGTEATALTGEDRAMYAQAKADAAKHVMDVASAMAEWREARRLLSSIPANERPTLTAVVEAGIAALRRTIHPTTTVVSALLASKQGHDLDGRYRRDLETQLTDFAKAFPGDISAITTQEIEQWINGRKKQSGEPLGTVRRNHVRDNVVHLFQFARSRGMLPDRITAAHQVAKIKAHAGDIEIFSPEEMRTLLSHVERDWLPWLAIAGFSGVRVEEIALSYHAAERKDALRWEDFDWLNREINVRGKVAKTGSPRRPPISENLYQWLAPWRDSKATGPVASGSLDKFRKRFKRKLANIRLDRAAQLAEIDLEEFKNLPQAAQEWWFGQTGISPRLIEWPHNALRHSYGSYRMAEIRNMNQLSYEMGDSVAMIKRHYHNPRPPSEAVAWFGIAPKTPANVVSIERAV